MARTFALDYGKELAGLVLMEGVDPSGSGSRLWHEAGQGIDMIRSRAQSARLTQVHVPLIVLSASHPGQDHLTGPTYGESAASIAKWRQQQQTTTRLSKDAIWVVAHAGHVVQQDNPAATREAVRVLLSGATTNQPLHCSHVWKSVQATCTE